MAKRRANGEGNIRKEIKDKQPGLSVSYIRGMHNICHLIKFKICELLIDILSYAQMLCNSNIHGKILKKFPFGSDLGQKIFKVVFMAEFTVEFDKAEFDFQKQSNNSR